MNQGKQKILIIDDSPVNIEFLKNILADEYETSFATDGENGLKSVFLEVPDLILLDVMMPGMNGLDVCQRLKADTRTSEIPVIFISARSEIDDEARGLEMGAIDYITKPFSPHIVRVRVKNHLELKRRGDILKNLAILDGLTGIPNRRRFDEFLDREWHNSIRNGSPISLVLIDIDHFKSFNDNYGHPAGDECLRMVAQAIARNVVRTTDIAARYGGEEFGVILSATELDGAIQIARKLNEAVLSLGIEHDYSTGSKLVTVSSGVASILPSQEMESAQLIEAADRCLYRAKENGRNRVAS